MRVFITGGTGFIGRALVSRLRHDGHSMVLLARSPERARTLLGDDVGLVSVGGGSGAMIDALRTCDAVVNLAGEVIVGKRWTAARRRLLEESRVGVTTSVVDAMTAAGGRPAILLSASGSGYYGDRGAEILTEASGHGDDFLARLCVAWEAAAKRATDVGVRVVVMRQGVVLGRGGGALAQMLPPFRLGLGGPIGPGRQYFPWIHLQDLVNVYCAALTDDRYHGPVNCVAPEEATGRTFARALGRALRRPAILPVPALALRALFGEGASVLLGSQRVEPRVLKDRGFTWAFPRLDAALSDAVVRSDHLIGNL
jgi:uncharacterized protein